MKLAVIAPPDLLDTVAESGLAYHMALGQELFRDRFYYKYYRTFAEKGHFIIVDNGAAEPIEERVPFHNVVHASLELGADEIILPDVMRDTYATLDASRSPKVLQMVPQHKRMVVPQGRDWEGWRYCLITLVASVLPVSIGIPKHLEDLPGGRKRAIRTIVRLGYHKRCNIHLLGVRAHPFKEVVECLEVFEGIRGIDTGAPIAYAQHDHEINDAQHFSLDWRNTNVTYKHAANVRQYSRFIATAPLRVKNELTPQTAKS
jgi:hypothetical protein